MKNNIKLIGTKKKKGSIRKPSAAIPLVNEWISRNISPRNIGVEASRYLFFIIQSPLFNANYF